MSWPERLVQDHRQQTDRAIHRAYTLLAPDPSTRKIFGELLHCARKRAPRLLEAPIVNAHHLGVDALIHLARFHKWHVRPVFYWAGTGASWRPAIASLAHHLICNYNVPLFLSSCWYANGASGDTQRHWFARHARGASFRSLGLPIAMTRKMEHIFLASRDHLSIEQALRHAELQALDVPPKFVHAILATRLATDLTHGEFWRAFWHFLIANASDIDPAQIGPMIDCIHALRHGDITTETRDGIRNFGPPQPAFSIKGRTAQSMLRLMRDWHRSLGDTTATFSWKRSPFEPMVIDEPPLEITQLPKRWQMIELTDTAQLRQEGKALRHCVASYAYRCYYGMSSVWSLRVWKGAKLYNMLTVEIDPKRRMVIQARGRENRLPSGRPLRLLQQWAAQERIRMIA